MTKERGMRNIIIYRPGRVSPDLGATDEPHKKVRNYDLIKTSKMLDVMYISKVF